MPTLRELDAHLLRYDPVADGQGGVSHAFVEDVPMPQAHGIRFGCPKSFAANGGMAGAHFIIVYFRGSPVPAELGKNTKGETVRWQASGTGIDDLSLAPSIQEESNCGWHGWVGNSGVPRGSAA